MLFVQLPRVLERGRRSAGPGQEISSGAPIRGLKLSKKSKPLVLNPAEQAV